MPPSFPVAHSRVKQLSFPHYAWFKLPRPAASRFPSSASSRGPVFFVPRQTPLRAVGLRLSLALLRCDKTTGDRLLIDRSIGASCSRRTAPSTAAHQSACLGHASFAQTRLCSVRLLIRFACPPTGRHVLRVPLASIMHGRKFVPLRARSRRLFPGTTGAGAKLSAAKNCADACLCLSVVTPCCLPGASTADMDRAAAAFRPG
ncbi:hypothetical protein ERJ75_001077800 [Trypanosoma vivax]|nr:hypothetical protein ERJ75_001077800 [Trypanosoma vivax]